MARTNEFILDQLTSTNVPINGKQSLWRQLFNWLPAWKQTSETQLEEAEREVLKSVKSDHKDLYVPIARDAVIRTYVAEPTEAEEGAPRHPLVMIHGFGAGFLQFYKNLDHLHSHRRLLALDIPGFGRSTRVSFTPDAMTAEEEMVKHIETWRRIVGVERFVLLGHSLGAFLACSYAIHHPSHVQHLILVDPWGFFPALSEEEMKKRFPFLAKTFWQMVGKMKPFDAVRMAGPLGGNIIQKMRPDLYRNFGENFMNYVYHCNVQKPTGEEAFYQMQYMYGWAKCPMLPRLGRMLDSRVPITLVLGQNSWMKAVSDGRCLGEAVSRLRPESYVDLHYVPNGGHHVHADQPEMFCELVNAACAVADSGGDRQPKRLAPSEAGRGGKEAEWDPSQPTGD
jgi:pimeloyl-ACP methyl ester carboxylesterase